MKKILPSIILAFTLVSCFKNTHRDLGPDDYPNGYIRYQVNGWQLEYSGGYDNITSAGIGVYCLKEKQSATVPSTRYTVKAQLGAAKTINIVIVTDSLQVGSYTTGTTIASGITSATVDSNKYYNNRPIDFLNVYISRFSEGTIDGTFSGRLSSAKTENGSNAYQDGLITNGFFQNVWVRE